MGPRELLVDNWSSVVIESSEVMRTLACSAAIPRVCRHDSAMEVLTLPTCTCNSVQHSTVFLSTTGSEPLVTLLVIACIPSNSSQ